MEENAEASQSPLPALALHAKVVVFELQCPACFRIWRSAAPRVLYYLQSHVLRDDSLSRIGGYNLLTRVPALQPYFVERQGPDLLAQIHFAHCYPESVHSRHAPTFRYVVQYPDSYGGDPFSIWQPKKHEKWNDTLRPLGYDFESHCPSCKYVKKYVDYTSHISNDVLAAQVNCPADLSLDEFIAFAHLRSGGSLQWLNILQGLRSRTLNLRRHQVHFLLSHAVSQVGPLDLNTGTWIWHQELQDSSFCNALLDELENLLTDVRAGLMDGVLMNTISLLLTRVLASSPSEDVSQRTITLLRSVRRKTFSWVQELSYDLVMAPTNKERSSLMRDMASTCRSTFVIDPATHCKLFHSAEDVNALLSCAFFIHTLHPNHVQFMKMEHPRQSHFNRSIRQCEPDQYSRLLLQRDFHLSLALEQFLMDAICADVSDYAIDLAVSMIFASHRPGTHKWNHLQYPNARWLTCETTATLDQPSKTILVDLLDGALRVNGQLVGGLPDEIRNAATWHQIFQSVRLLAVLKATRVTDYCLQQGFFVIPSNLPGMDFMTLGTTSKYKASVPISRNLITVIQIVYICRFTSRFDATILHSEQKAIN